MGSGLERMLDETTGMTVDEWAEGATTDLSRLCVRVAEV